MAWGSRLVAASTSGIFFPLPLLPQLFIQGFSIMMIRNNTSLCSTQLMTYPVTIERLRVFISLGSEVLLPTSSVQNILPPGSECHFIFTLLHTFFGITCCTVSMAFIQRFPGVPAHNGPSIFVIWWVGLILTWAFAVMLTAYT